MVTFVVMKPATSLLDAGRINILIADIGQHEIKRNEYILLV